MAGLDNIKHFEGGGETGEEATAAAPLTAKSVVAKGPYALPTPTGNVGVPQSLLENMQKLITEREMQKDSFMERMKDANAWWSGGVAGPGEALRARQAEREGQAATTFGMKSQLAQHKAAQEREANLATQLFGTPPTKATTGAGVAPTATGVAPTATGVGNAPTGKLIDLVLDPGLKQSIMVTAQSQGNEAAQKQIHAYLAENAKNPEFIKTINILVRQGLIDPSLVASIGLTHLVGSGSFTPQKINTPGGVVQTTPFDTAQSIVGATPPPAKIASPTTSKTLMSPQDLASQIQKDFKIDLGPAALERDAKMQGNLVDRAAKKEKGIYMPDPVIAGKDKYHVGAIDVPLTVPESYLNARGYYRPLGAKDPVHAVPIPQQDNTQGASNVKIAGVLPHVQPIAKISNVSQTSTGFTPGSDQDLAIRQKRAEANIEIESKGPEQASTEAGKRRAKMFELADSTDNTVKAADMIIAASTSHPESTGLGKGRTGTNLLSTVAGALVPKMNKESAEDTIASFGKPESVKAREAISGGSKQLGIDFAANVFKGARMGIGLENMAARAKNVSEYNTAETNIVNAKIIKEAALFNKARSELYTKWAPNNGGTFADFEKFETSPEYKQLAKQTQDKIAASLPQYLKIGKDGLEETDLGKKLTGNAPHPGESLVEKYKTKKKD